MKKIICTVVLLDPETGHEYYSQNFNAPKDLLLAPPSPVKDEWQNKACEEAKAEFCRVYRTFAEDNNLVNYKNKKDDNENTTAKEK